MNTPLYVEQLIRYGLKEMLIDENDVHFVRNTLLAMFGLDDPYYGEVPEELPALPQILNNLCDDAFAKGLFEHDNVVYRDLFDTKIMGALVARPSDVVRTFYALLKEDSKKATDYFYHLACASNYIRTDRIAKNLSWDSQTPYGPLTITVNLAKPEISPNAVIPKAVKKERPYPRCMLCVENPGYVGRTDFPARQTLRTIPLTLSGESWNMQYSPYVYYNEHCIVFSSEHRPMLVNRDTFVRLAEFVDLFPHYFLGSNAGLPVVGGSILSHDHYQGGNEVLPLEHAKNDWELTIKQFPGIKAETIKWPVATIRAHTKDRGELVEFCNHVLTTWQNYFNEGVQIKAYSEENGVKTLHNAITPTLRKTEDGTYTVNLILRNNVTTPEYPAGLYHAHPEHYHIKKENIGVIEVMGLAILPGRLLQNLDEISDILCGKTPYEPAELQKAEHPLNPHAAWITFLMEKYGSQGCTKAEAKAAVEQEVGVKFSQILGDVSVFKETDSGKAAFKDYLAAAGFELV